MKCSNCEYNNKENAKFCYKCGKELKTKKLDKIFLITNYITIGLIYLIIVRIYSYAASGDTYTASVASWVSYFWILAIMLISFPLLLINIITGIKKYKIKKDNSIIANIVILIILHLPIIIGILKIYR